MGFNRNILDAERMITKEKLEELYTIKKLSDREIGNIYGISGGRIHRLRNKYKIKAIEYYQRHHKQKLDKIEKAFIIDSLLGDGHLRLRKKSGERSYPQLMIEQTIKHREYIYWLKEQIKEWLFDPMKPLKQVRKFSKKTNKTYHSYPFQTICHPVFDEFYESFYKNRKKIINIDFIAKYFTLYSFAIWIMDDGTRSKRGRRIKLCSHNFSRDENDLLRSFLNKNFGLEAHIRKVSGKYYYLDFSIDSTNFISEMVRELIIPEMQYKIVPSETTKSTESKILKV